MRSAQSIALRSHTPTLVSERPPSTAVSGATKPAPKPAPTSWTKPLQTAVIAFFAASAVFNVTIPLWMTSVGRGAVWAATALGLAIDLLVVIGAIRRWMWLYDVVWAWLGLGIAVLVFNVAQGSYSLTYAATAPDWAGWVRVLQNVVGGALALAMLYARRAYGRWGMTVSQV